MASNNVITQGETPGNTLLHGTSGALGTVQPDGTPFRFSDLARELRDSVYSNLLEGAISVEKKAAPDDEGCTREFKVLSFRLPNLRLVCRQFKEEYEKVVFTRAEAILGKSIHRPEDIRSVVPSRLASLLPLLQHVVIRVQARYTYQGRPLEEPGWVISKSTDHWHQRLLLTKKSDSRHHRPKRGRQRQRGH